MNTFPIMLATLCVFALGYRYYSAFLAAKVLVLDDRRTTPAHEFEDGHNYVPSPKWVLFGHHFAAIAGAGPLVGPTLAAQFGFAPGFLWILLGAVFAGCVHDFTVLVASIRHKGRSLAQIARSEAGPWAGLVTMIALLFILLVTLAGLGIVVVNALSNSPWGVFTIAMTIPIAILMGLLMFKTAPGQVKIAGPSAVGVVLLIASVIGGRWFAEFYGGGSAHIQRAPDHDPDCDLRICGFGAAGVVPAGAARLPFHLHEAGDDRAADCRRVRRASGHQVSYDDAVHSRRRPHHQGQAVSISVRHHCVRSDLGLSLADFVGDHAQDAGQGKRRANHRLRSDAVRRHGGGAGADRCHVDVSGRLFRHQHHSRCFREAGHVRRSTSNLFSQQVGEQLAGRTGGAVSLAVGMAQIFRGLPGMHSLMSYWYHYAIMFEALFILTTVDTGTRVARYVMQELMGRVHKPFANTKWWPGTLGCNDAGCAGLGIPHLHRETSLRSGRCLEPAINCWRRLR